MTVEIKEEGVREDLNFFDDMLTLIPASLYFKKDEDPEEYHLNKYAKKKTPESKKLQLKMAEKERLEKLDPSKVKSTHELQEEFLQREMEEIEEKTGNIVGKKRNRADMKSTNEILKSQNGSGLDQDSKEKLRKKIQELRENRNADKAAEKDKDKPPKKRAKNEKKNNHNKSGNKKNNSTEKVDSEKKLANLEKKIEKIINDHDAADDNEVTYSTFEYSAGKPIPSYLAKKNNKKLSPQELLKKVEKQKELLKELEKTDEGKSIALQRKAEIAIKKIQGEKVRDDVTRIKKSIKRKEVKKEKSKAKWEDRKRTEKKSQEARQKKREENIKKRKERKTSGKKGKRPGFEGKKKKPKV